MTIDDILKTTNPPADKLREAFIEYCLLLGLDEDACLGLTMLLNTRWSMIMMLAYFHQSKDQGPKLTETEIVLMAEKIATADDLRVKHNFPK